MIDFMIKTLIVIQKKRFYLLHLFMFGFEGALSFNTAL